MENTGFKIESCIFYFISLLSCDKKSGARLSVSPTAHVYICLISCYPDCKSFTLQRGVFNLRVILNLIFIVIVFKIMISKRYSLFYVISFLRSVLLMRMSRTTCRLRNFGI